MCVCERDLERLLTQHQAQGKSNQAISKPRRSAPATLAPHNYNTIWQRYWAQIPCYFCSPVYPARTWFYIKVPKTALTPTYWKARPCSKGEWANTATICWLFRVKEGQGREWPKYLSCLRWRAHFFIYLFFEKVTFNSTPPLKGDLIVLAERRIAHMHGGRMWKETNCSVVLQWGTEVQEKLMLLGNL